MAQIAKDQRSSSCSFQGVLNSQDGSSFSPLINFHNLPSLSPSPGFYMFEDDQYHHHHHQKQQHHLGLNHSDSYTEGHHGVMSESQQQVVSNSPDLSISSSADSSNEFAFSTSAASYHQLDDQAAPSLIHFKTTQGNGGGGFINGSGGSSISFQQEAVDYGFVGQEKENYAWWESSIINDYPNQHQAVKGSGLRVLEGVLNHELSKDSDMMYGEAMRSGGEINAKESTNKQQACFKKRAITGEDNIQTPKKKCTSSKKQAISKQAKSSSPPTSSKDSMQSAAAKNRRERISERLKTLQDLVPNGSKVDMVTMLEKAIGYVKFLQLQVKVLAADEFWPAAGGKAPDISQVREALDAILQRDRSSTSQ